MNVWLYVCMVLCDGPAQHSWTCCWICNPDQDVVCTDDAKKLTYFLYDLIILKICIWNQLFKGYDWCRRRVLLLAFLRFVFSENPLAISNSFFLVAVEVMFLHYIIKNGSYCTLFIIFLCSPGPEKKCLTFSHVLQFVSELSVIWYYCACLKWSRGVVVTCKCG